MKRLKTLRTMPEKLAGTNFPDCFTEPAQAVGWNLSLLPKSGKIRMEKKLILLVEDNPDDVALTLRAFEKSKIANNMIVACDGVEGLKRSTAVT